MNNKTALILLVLFFAGYGFMIVGWIVSWMGFLLTVGVWILFVVVYYDYYRTEKKWRQKKPLHS